ncbi:MAG: hypothetical protein PHV07_09660 [Oscillospiraceae bacterium]|nr:hypothetical protein [Oscillospiraceae bacterium]
MSVPNSYKGAKRTIFVQAASKKQLKEVDGVLKIYDCKDIQLNECPFEIKFGAIVSKM